MTRQVFTLTKALDEAHGKIARLTETVQSRDADLQALRMKVLLLDQRDAQIASLLNDLARARGERDESRVHNTRLRDRLVKQNRQAVAVLARIVKMHERARSGRV